MEVNWNNVILAMEFTSLLFLIILFVSANVEKTRADKKFRYSQLCLILSMVALTIEIFSYAFDGNIDLYIPT